MGADRAYIQLVDSDNQASYGDGITGNRSLGRWDDTGAIPFLIAYGILILCMLLGAIVCCVVRIRRISKLPYQL
ncbi:hypothetical protein GOP47_0005886 [Adiantum capillus-veneris]|uniref:Uncharacterized protein n=1 Tax=Adiantum capillus-veneris TaxID=13818 RepID=A0A9D4V2E9_ADICA|nr:hypothetical protein GOP47_0005886 [Adiantum capillus-veneris]